MGAPFADIAVSASVPEKPTPKEAHMRKLIVSTYATLDGRVDEIQDGALPDDDAAAARYH